MHLQLGFEQFGSITKICKSNIKIYIKQKSNIIKLKRIPLVIAVISLIIGAITYQSALDQIAEIAKIIRDSQAGVGARYSTERLQQMNDDAEITLMAGRGFLGLSVLMLVYGLYDNIIKAIRRVKYISLFCN